MAKKITISVFILLSLTLSFLAGSLFGMGQSSALPDSGEAVLISPQDYETFLSYARLTEISGMIDEIYLGEYTTQDLLTGAAKGMVYALNDPYADYLTPEEAAEYRQSQEGNYVGVGMQVFEDPADGLITVSGVFLDSPALESGVLIGDKVLAVDGEDVRGISMDVVVATIRGDAGTPVTVTFSRKGESIDMTMVRAEVIANRVTRRMIGDIGYIRIDSFTGDDVQGFKEAIAFIEGQKAKALIIDLRNNGGGLVSDVIEIADMLLPQGLIFYTENKYGERGEYSSNAKHLGLPLAVLVNEYSASASEILAGAVQDHGVGVLVGKRTFGKGIVQTQVPFKDDGAAIRLTTDYYYTPNGRCIHDEGLVPDYDVDNSDYARQNPMMLEDAQDDQLMKAIDVLGQSIGR